MCVTLEAHLLGKIGEFGQPVIRKKAEAMLQGVCRTGQSAAPELTAHPTCTRSPPWNRQRSTTWCSITARTGCSCASQCVHGSQIMALEQRRVFEQCWLYAGHASEIPQPDFRARRGGAPGHPGAWQRWRGPRPAQYLHAPRGAGLPGELWQRQDLSVLLSRLDLQQSRRTHRRAGGGRLQCAFDRQELGLASPPRVEIYRDFIFISFNPIIENLVDYLAGARQYLDLVCDQSEAGMEIVTGTQAYAANWKLLVENSMDGYHARTTHQRYFEFFGETGVDPSQMRGRRGGVGKALGNGHAVIQSEPYGDAPLRAGPQCSGRKKGRTGGLQQKIIERFGANGPTR